MKKKKRWKKTRTGKKKKIEKMEGIEKIGNERIATSKSDFQVPIKRRENATCGNVPTIKSQILRSFKNY